MKLESHIKANHGKILLLICAFYLIISPYILLRILCPRMQCSVFSVPFLLLYFYFRFLIKMYSLYILEANIFRISFLPFPCSHLFPDRDKPIRCFHYVSHIQWLLINFRICIAGPLSMDTYQHGESRRTGRSHEGKLYFLNDSSRTALSKWNF